MRKLGTEQRQSLESATWWYQSQAATGAGSVCLTEYILKRGLDETLIRRYRLGYVGIPHKPEHEPFTGRMAIPYLTHAGVVDIKFRCIEQHDCKQAKCTKYLYVTGGGNRLYNARAVLAADDQVVITEGELDAMAVSGMCGIPAVGYPGVDSWGHRLNSHWPRVFHGLSAIVVADGDEPGLKAAKAVAKTIENARVVPMPDGHDSNSFIAEHGPDDFGERIGWPLQAS